LLLRFISPLLEELLALRGIDKKLEAALASSPAHTFSKADRDDICTEYLLKAVVCES
jgi:hypothetical protein